jgi:hypothetical protein
MAKKRVAKKVIAKRVEQPHIEHYVHVKRNGLSMDKSEGLMALMAAVLVVLTYILDAKVSAILAVVLMVVFAGYKLLKR